MVSMKTLALKYRPNHWNALIGQTMTSEILRRMILAGTLPPLLIFSGPRGTGKTTTARMVAKAVNCPEVGPAADPCNQCPICSSIDSESCPDVVEMDAASNGGVSEVRSMASSSLYRTSVANTRVYILDEAHAMTNAAFQAALKLFEEPPPNNLFIMATTEPDRIPDTIFSRAFSFAFRRVSSLDIYKRLVFIAETEEIKIDEPALRLIASSSKGGVRDALTLMDQLSVLEQVITLDMVREAIGFVTNDDLFGLLDAVMTFDLVAVMEIINGFQQSGIEAAGFMQSLLNYLNELIVSLAVGAESGFSQSERAAIGAAITGGTLTLEKVLLLHDLVLRITSDLNRVPIDDYVMIEASFLAHVRKDLLL